MSHHTNILTILMNPEVAEDNGPIMFATERIIINGNPKKCYDLTREIIENPEVDPAKILLRHLIFNDAAFILASLTVPNSPLTKGLFKDIEGITKTTMSDEATGIQMATTYRNFNVKNVNGEYVPGEQSATLRLLADYLDGNLIDPTPLLYAITSRVWKMLEGGTLESLRSVALIYHTYLFIVSREMPTLASDHDWETYNYQYRGGNPNFMVMARPTDPKLNGNVVVYGRKTYHIGYNDCPLTFIDYGEDGLAFSSPHGDDIYFLSYPPDYESSAYLVTDTLPVPSQWDEVLDED